MAHISDEQQLVESLARGDKNARARVYKQYVGAIGGICRRYIGNDNELKDVVQDTFIEIFSSAHRFRRQDRGSLWGWMHRIAVRVAIRHLRNNKLLENIDEIEIPDSTEEEPPPIITRLTAEQIMGCIQSLSATYRTVCNLYLFEHKTHIEIGKILGIEPDSSAARLSRAKQKLREIIISRYGKE